MPVFAGFEIPQIKVPNADANESFHPVSDGLEHVTNLPFEAGVEDHFKPARGEAFDGDGAGLANFGEDTFFELGNDVGFES